MDNTVAILACAKEEELYIKEWLDWHIKIGIDHFYIADNNDSDYPIKLKDVIKDYIDKGIVEIFDYNNVHPIQPYCYDDMYQNNIDKYDWYFLLDIDEFVQVPAFNNDLKAYLNSAPNYVYQIGFLWRSYDDNDLIYYEDKPVLERFTRPAVNGKDVSDVTKTIFKTFKYSGIDKVWHQHAPLFMDDLGNIPYKINKNNYRYLDNSVKRYDVLFKNDIKNCLCLFYGVKYYLDKDTRYIKKCYEVAYIKHFKFKSVEEYCRKILRGDTYRKYNNPKFPYYFDRYYEVNSPTSKEKAKIYIQLYKKAIEN